jgi:phage terminase large subunit-like protein
MRENPGHRGRIIAPTLGDAVEACIEGPSGLLSVDPSIRWHASAPGGSKVSWPNGSEAIVLGTPTPRDIERLRAGGNRHIDWWEEMASNPMLRQAWDQAQLGLRMGRNLRSIASTTPKGTRDYQEIRALPGVVLTHATTLDNPHNPPEWVARMRARHEGTRLGRQELMGELLEDVPGALWTVDTIESSRVILGEHVNREDLLRVCVAIDPAVTSNEDSDDSGIIVVARGPHQPSTCKIPSCPGHGYVLEDATCHESPTGTAKRAIAAYDAWDADRIIGEVNNGGDYIGTVVHTVRAGLPYSVVKATVGKKLRAEPASAAYEQGRVHHVGRFDDLEQQMETWTPDAKWSPDRLDALVWGLTELGLVTSSDGWLTAWEREIAAQPEHQTPTELKHLPKMDEESASAPNALKPGCKHRWQRWPNGPDTCVLCGGPKPTGG